SRAQEMRLRITCLGLFKFQSRGWIPNLHLTAIKVSQPGLFSPPFFFSEGLNPPAAFFRLLPLLPAWGSKTILFIRSDCQPAASRGHDTSYQRMSIFP